MAEERIIDDDLDKNKKYKIRKNADGEDELYFDGEEGESEVEYGAELYEVPAFSEDDEDAGVLTPDQLAARADARRMAEESVKRRVKEYLLKAEERLKASDFDGALAAVSAAENADDGCGAAYALKIKALTRNFNDFSDLDGCAACSENIRLYCTDEQKEELSSLSGNLERRLEELKKEADGLRAEVEAKKAERRAVFVKERNGSVKWFVLTALPFVVFLALAVSFGSVIFAKQNGFNLILTIVFAVLAALFFVATVITARRMSAAIQKYSLNEKNSSTQIGRDYERLLSEIKKLNAVSGSFKK